jgi:hypothetical protein
MYCRNCIKKWKKVCMSTLVKEGVYMFPECGSKIYWSSQKEGELEE